jgi:cephalosporin hydroxylase
MLRERAGRLPGPVERCGRAAWHVWGSVVTRSFNRYFYARADLTWGRTSWLGVPLWKNPLDLWVYQEILWEVGPSLIVETGTYRGGSALYIASLCDLMGYGKVLTIDIERQADRPPHPRIEYVTGSSVSPKTIDLVEQRVGEASGPVLVVLDSDHHAPHVQAELDTYHRFVTPGSYLIVEDTNINGHPVKPFFGPGPMEAVASFLPRHPEFAVDRSRERYLVTHNPGGYLRRCAP